MDRAMPALMLLLAATGSGVAAESGALEKAYTDRLIAMDDTAAAHVQMARWCEENGLADRAETHWREALALDPTSAAARQALAPRPAETAPAADISAPSTAPPTADPGLAGRRQAIWQEVREIDRQYLVPTDEQAWNEGKVRILMLREPAAVEPIAQVLGAGTRTHQQLACEALSGIPGEEARRELTKVLLTTPDKDVYLAALDGLKRRNDPPDHATLTRALGGQTDARQRAAYALGELGAWGAAGALVDHLKVRRPKILEAPAVGGGTGNGAYIAIGRAITYVRDAEPIVSDAAVGWDPDIGTIMAGAVLSVRNVRVVAHRRIIEIIAPEPVVREALRKITGQDFGYDQTAWRRYLSDLRREQ